MTGNENQKTVFSLYITEPLFEVYFKNRIQTKGNKLCVHRFSQCNFKGKKYNGKTESTYNIMHIN